MQPLGRLLVRRCLIAALVFLGSASTSVEVHAQLNVMSPVFRDLNGGAIWGSFGAATHSQARSVDRRPIWRAGFAAFYGPFGGGGDTMVVTTYTVADSTDTLVAGEHGTMIKRRIALVRQHRSDMRQLGHGGKVLLAGGYQHSGFYRISSTPLASPVAVGGVYLAGFLGPYPVPGGARRLAWYVGVGATVVQLSNAAGRADTLAVKLSTERTVAPEFYLMSTYMVSPGYRIMISGSYQVLRFGSIAYQTVESGRTIPAAILGRLPEEIRLDSWHLNLGVSFTASSLIPSR